VTYAAPPAQPTAVAGCNCLSKSYMPDNSVVFTDNCTKETAVLVPQGQAAYQQPYQPH
jgi:hypothetical protein